MFVYQPGTLQASRQLFRQTYNRRTYWCRPFHPCSQQALTSTVKCVAVNRAELAELVQQRG